MHNIRERALKRELLKGTFLSLGSSMIAEMAGLAGFDWLLLDLEHAPGDTFSLIGQMQAVNRLPTASVVRIPNLDKTAVKRILDLGAAGIMVPNLDNVKDVKDMVSFMRYHPGGVRGLGTSTRAASYGFNHPNYMNTANDRLLTVIQIENQGAVDNCEAFAAIDGVDVLFVGPMDLGVMLGMPKRFDDPAFVAVLQRVADAAKANGKSTGILVADPKLVPVVKQMGYNFVALSSDTNLLVKSFKEVVATLNS